MTRAVLLAVVAAQVLDLCTWMAMPPAAEVNSIARGFHTPEAWLAKALLLLAVICIQPALHSPELRKPILNRWLVPWWVHREVGELVALVAVAAGFVGAGSNLAAISWVSG